jgi:hypothetical protein
MGPLVEREGMGPFEQASNAFFYGDASTDFHYFVVGPIEGTARLLRVEWEISGLLTAAHQLGASIGRRGDASEAAYREGWPILQRSNMYTWLGHWEWAFEVFDSLGKQLSIPLLWWVGEGSWYLVVHFKAQSVNVYARHFVTVVSERYFV